MTYYEFTEYADTDDERRRWFENEMRDELSCAGFNVVDLNGPRLPRFIANAEESVFRDGWREGFEFAIDVAIKLYGECGFIRGTEINNILVDYFNRVVGPWSGMASADGKMWHYLSDESFPFEFNHESWGDIRKRILRRDKACVRCGDVIQLEVDHIKEVKDGGLPVDSNLRALCKACHTTKWKWDV